MKIETLTRHEHWSGEQHQGKPENWSWRTEGEGLENWRRTTSDIWDEQHLRPKKWKKQKKTDKQPPVSSPTNGELGTCLSDIKKWKSGKTEKRSQGTLKNRKLETRHEEQLRVWTLRKTSKMRSTRSEKLTKWKQENLKRNEELRIEVHWPRTRREHRIEGHCQRTWCELGMQDNAHLNSRSHTDKLVRLLHNNVLRLGAIKMQETWT